MDHPRSVSAEYRIVFDGSKPVVTARRGIIAGHRARMNALTIKVTALTQPDGSVGISTHLDPEWDRSGWVYNPDGFSAHMVNLIELDVDQIPNRCHEWHDFLVDAVHALHPDLRFRKAASA